MKGINFIWFSLFLFGSELSSSLSSRYEECTDSRNLIAQYSRWRMKDMPEFATMVGIHDYDTELNDMSIQAYAKRNAIANVYLLLLDRTQPSETDPIDIINLKVMRYELETFTKFYHYKGFYMALNQMQGPQYRIYDDLLAMPRNTLVDYNTLLERMKKIPKQIDQTIELLKAGVKNNIAIHNISLTGAASSIRSIVTENAADSSFYTFFSNDFPESLSQEEKSSLQETAKNVISSKISPAFKKLADYLENEYVPRPDISISSINDGSKFYSALIQYHTGTNLTAKEIHDIGLKEVDRTIQDMNQVKDEMGSQSLTLTQFNNQIKSDPNNLFRTPEELVSRIEYYITESLPPYLSNYFSKIPKAELKIEEISYGPLAYYTPGSIDGTKPGVFTINTGNLDAVPRDMLLSLTLHEALPGHHFQSSIAIESEDYPIFRKVSDTSNYGHAPSMFPIYTAYVEGWGLYAETLGFDMMRFNFPLYNEPLERYGHYIQNMLRSCRLVVDTGIHALGWTQEAAVQYLLDNTLLSRDDAESEIQRYITIPGQALAYKMGQIKIEELRNEAQAALGDSFSLMEFNDIVVDSMGPMSLVEEQVAKWISSSLNEE